MDDIVFQYNNNKNYDEFLLQLSKFRFSLENMEFKKDRYFDDPVIQKTINILKSIPSIQNKEILYDSSFIKYFYDIFWNLIQRLGIGTQNFYVFIPIIVNELNRITVDNYVVYDCHSTDNYNCGRAMIIIDKSPSRLLIFNTDETGHMDVNTQLLYTSDCKSVNGQEISLNEISLYFPKYYGRIKKEISMIIKKYKVKLRISNGVLKILIPDVFISLTLDSEYPFSSPSGTFKDMTISEIDLNWSDRNTLLNVINTLLNKKIPRHIEFLCYLLDF